MQHSDCGLLAAAVAAVGGEEGWWGRGGPAVGVRSVLVRLEPRVHWRCDRTDAVGAGGSPIVFHAVVGTGLLEQSFTCRW